MSECVNCYIHRDTIAALRSQLAESEQRRKNLDQWFGNVLARIHGDGGHYIAAHGWEKACVDAERIVTELREEADRWKDRYDRLLDGH